MKKRLCVLLIVITLCSLAACGAAAASASEQTQPVLPAETPLPTREPTPLPTAEPTPQPLSETETGELDLTGMSGTMLYTMIYNMMKQPDDYLGGRSASKGSFLPMWMRRAGEAIMPASLPTLPDAARRGWNFFRPTRLSIRTIFPSRGRISP